MQEKYEELSDFKKEIDEIRKEETQLSSKKMDEDQRLGAVVARIGEKKKMIGFTKDKVGLEQICTCLYCNFIFMLNMLVNASHVGELK